MDQEDRDRLIRIDERTERIEKAQEDHETRIRWLERIAWALGGAWALISTWLGIHVSGHK